MKGSKVGQFLKDAFHNRSSSGGDSTADSSNSRSTAVPLQDGSSEANSSSRPTAAASRNGVNNSAPSSPEQTLFFDVDASKQHSKSSNAAMEPPLPFQTQQHTTADMTEPVRPLPSKIKSVKIIAAAESIGAADGEPSTPFQAAADAGSSRNDSLHTNSVSIISPQLRSMSTSNALLNAGSMSAGRGGGLNRKSIAAMSLSPNLGMDGFKIRIGICAMDKKANSKPMKEIVSRLEAFGEFETVYFGDDLILNRPITEWPKVDCLMSWYSDGFPLNKAQAYADSTHPFLINDLHMQDTLQDRRAVYQVLRDNGIAVPSHIVVDRDDLESGQEPAGFIEEEDYVELDGVRIDKPFVEKPASGEDHNIHIYYPHSMGGGVKRLFRKIDNKSSCYDPNHPGTVRRDGSYIYEEFLATGGTDVKVYTVGPRYAHAEARKSPVVDGRVLRSADGKEMRFPVLLSPAEKEISRTVCLAFGQKVCGFDLLRSEKGRSYVCDVNGWSFVKNSRKYYDDAAGILRSTILAALAPHRLTLAPAAANPLSLSSRGLSPLSQQSTASTAAVAAAAAAVAASGAYDEESLGILGKSASLQELSNLMGELSGVDLLDATRTDERSTREELRCVLAVIRHGDRTPKQKLKVRVRQPALLQLFTRHADSKGKQAKLKSPAQLQELLDICRQLLQDLQHPPPTGLSEEELEAREEQKEKLNIVKTVLEQGGQFSGINRKVQLKPLLWSTPQPITAAQPPLPAAATAAAAVGESEGASDAGKQQGEAANEDPKQQQQQQQQQEKPVIQEVLLILKYGGVLTHAGRAQAEELGKVFRLVMYPRFGSGGGGLLRLHSTYRHDLKIYSSDEGRVQVSAAAFTKGLLALEGSSLTPILVSLVAKDASMLDAFGKGASDDIRRAKQILYTTMTWDPATATANNFTPTWSSGSRAATPAPTPGLLTSPPMSPRAMSRAGSSGTTGVAAAAAAGTAAPATSSSSSSSSKRELEAAVAAAHTGSDPTAADGRSSSSSSTQPTVTSPSAAGAAATGPAAAAAGGSNSLVMDNIPGMPDSPLQHLKKLNELMKTMVEQLRQLVLAEKRQGVVTTASSSAKDLLQAEAEAAAAAAAAAVTPEPRRSSSSGTGPAVSSSNGGQQQQQLLTSMTSLTSSTSLTDDLPIMTNPPSGLHKPPAGLPNSPPRPSTAPPGGAAASGGSSSSTGHSVRSSRYSSLSHDPQDWRLQGGQPCSGEKLLLMFDRWQKLAKSFYKKGRFDISKVPDIYDSAKYDALHNLHLGLGHTLEELYKDAKVLADAVIPNEYGVDPAGKLAIGSKIATELLAKLLDDLRASKEESLATLTDAERSGLGAVHKPGGSSSSSTGGGGSSSSTGDNAREGAIEARFDKPLGRKSMPLVRTAGSSGSSSSRVAAGSSSRSVPVLARSTSAAAAAAKAAQDKDSVTPAENDAEVTDAGSDHGVGGEAEVEGFEGDEYFFDEEPEMMHRLCPMYASDINSPLRHVRTRIYFTSESHMHSLVNILRLCHLRYQLFGNSSGSLPPGSSTLGSSSSGVTLVDPGYITPRASMDIPAAAAADMAAAAAAGRHSSSGGAAAAAGPPPSPGRFQQPPGAAAAMNGTSSSSSSSSAPPGPLISDAGLDLLKETSELDYLTQLVFRLYENKSVPADHPQRFRIEILFSPGTAYNPIMDSPAKDDHTLPPRPRIDLHIGEGATLADFDKLLRPFAAKRRQQQQQQQQGKEKEKDGK